MFLASAFMLLGKLVVVLGNCYFYMVILQHTLDNPEAPVDSTGPLACVALGTYITAEVTLGMFDEAVLALVTCRAIDMDLGGADGPQYGPPTFYDAEGNFKLEAKLDKREAD